VVRRGETIYAIGRAYAAKPARIVACNQLINPSRIHAGLNLAIPLAPWVPVPAGPTARRQFTPQCAPCPPVRPCRYYHTVQPRETLTTIAWRYGSSIWSIARANYIYNLNLIYPGQVLCIP
jgi:spore germination protein